MHWLIEQWTEGVNLVFCIFDFAFNFFILEFFIELPNEQILNVIAKCKLQNTNMVLRSVFQSLP